jgi:gamma-glutamylcyclotransferase (GGCT)/AIG2-like uncharacterized protein YtfP
MTDIHRLFVYGTLRSDGGHGAHSYIARYFSLMGKATVRGKLYDCVEYPAGLPSNEDHFITGELYQLKNAGEFAEAMHMLDEYEGSYDQPGQPTLFKRELANVLYNDDAITAWIYWYNRPVSGLQWIRSGDILKTDF